MAIPPPLNFCGRCGQPARLAIPDGDNRERSVCTACGHIHYENPRVVVGCVPEYEGRILLCRRAIQPRYGYWTVPAGFMELGESLQEAASRETWEEALARVTLGDLFAMVDVIQAGQVHAFFRGRLERPEFGAGSETLETRLFLPEEIPWDDLAFPSVRIALEEFLRRAAEPDGRVHLASATRRDPA